jgi:hypothetical protein
VLKDIQAVVGGELALDVYGLLASPGKLILNDISDGTLK